MACFLVPGTEAIVVSAIYAAVKKKENRLDLPTDHAAEVAEKSVGITWSKRLGWLLVLLWGGVLLLAFEHFWHGEVVPYPPLLTAMSSPDDTAEMLSEMSSVGVSMAITVTVFWALLCAAAEAKVKKIKAAVGQNA